MAGLFGDTPWQDDRGQARRAMPAYDVRWIVSAVILVVVLVMVLVVVL